MFQKIFHRIILVLIALFLLDAAIVLGIGNWQREIKDADSAIVLGAAIYSQALKNRTLKALELYEQGSVDRLVLSGGKIAARDISEAQGMQKIISQYASTSVPTILEDKSHNTYENIKYVRDKIGTDQHVVIVSDRFHVARGVLLAKRAGFKKVSWASPELTYYRKPEIIFYYLRELVALPSYLFKFINF